MREHNVVKRKEQEVEHHKKHQKKKPALHKIKSETDHQVVLQDYNVLLTHKNNTG